MRLIDADALVNDLEYDIAIDEDILAYAGTDQITRSTTQFDKDCKQNAIDLVMGTPTIDAVSVVRCKECKWQTKDQYDEPYCGFHSIGIYADDFCSYAERKEQ